MKLFIADDSVRYRQRLASILSRLDGITIIGEAGNVAEAIDSIQRTRPDALILDIQMPGGSGLDVLQAAKAIKPAPLIIMLTVAPSSEYRDKCLAMGADYFFEKASGLKKIALILARLMHGSKTDQPLLNDRERSVASTVNTNPLKAQKASMISLGKKS
jgi:DNA-binding NarL/FixJ family response regulator